MPEYADKKNETKSQSVANEISEKSENKTPAVKFVDNRPQTVAQKKLQEMSNASQQVSQLKAVQQMANGRNTAMPSNNSGAIANNGVVQLAATNEILNTADELWGTTMERIDEVDGKYSSYDSKLREQDEGPYNKISERAAEGVLHWTKNFNNKSTAYLAELNEAIKRTGGWLNPRIAALGMNEKTEPDMFILRGGGDFSADMGSDTDHLEVKHTEQTDKKGVMGLVYEAVKQLIDRSKEGRHMYRAVVHAPKVVESDVRAALQKGIDEYLPKKVEELAGKGTFLNIEIICGPGRIKLNSSQKIPDS